MRKDKQKNLAAFRQLIAAHIEKEPLEFDGHLWAAQSQEEWSKLLALDARTIRRLTAEPGIVSTCAKVEGRKMALYRLGELGKPTFRLIANTMAKIFRDETGKQPTRNDYGCLIGLAQELPDGSQIDIFKNTLKNWGDFMVGAKLQIAQNIEAGAPGQQRYLEFPSIAFIRRFHKVAIELYVIEFQGKADGKLPPDSIIALHPHLWKQIDHQAAAN